MRILNVELVVLAARENKILDGGKMWFLKLSLVVATMTLLGALAVLINRFAKRQSFFTNFPYFNNWLYAIGFYGVFLPSILWVLNCNYFNHEEIACAIVSALWAGPAIMNQWQ